MADTHATPVAGSPTPVHGGRPTPRFRVTVYANDTTGRQLQEWPCDVDLVGSYIGVAFAKYDDIRVVVARLP